MGQKTITAIIALTAMLTGAAVYMNASQPQEISPEVVVQFNTWLQTQHRLYASPNEMKQRLLNFKQTLERIAEINKSNKGYTAGLNQFSDLTKEEFAAKYLMKIDATQPLISKKKTTVYGTQGLTQVPDSLDLRVAAKATLPPVKNQGQCGSCYAFAATTAMEFA